MIKNNKFNKLKLVNKFKIKKKLAKEENSDYAASRLIVSLSDGMIDAGG